MARKSSNRVVILGNSAAGLSALEAFRKSDRDSKVLMVDKEPGLAYSRVITPYFVMGGVKSEESLFLKTEEYYRELDVKTLFGREVESIDTKERMVFLDEGKKEVFDLLLIATGGSPNRPKIRGAKPEEILVLRNLSDARRLKEIKPKAERIVFLGGGLVSIETLQALFTTKGKYVLIVKSDRVMSQTLDQEASEIVERHLSKMGVQIIKGRDVVELRQTKGLKVVVLDSGEEIETDFIFAGKGVMPNIGFLKGSRIKTQNGILVNERVETNVEGVYAAGDVAETPDFFSNERVNYGLWPSAIEQGEIAGKNMAGGRAVYPGNLKMNVVRIFALPVASIGDVGSNRVKEVLIKRDEKRNIYRKICLDEKGIVIGAILISQVEDLGILQGLIRQRKGAEFLKLRSIWKSPMNYGYIYNDILKARL